MTAATQFNSFIEYVNEKAINWQSDTFVLFLTNSAPSQSNTVLADITQVSYTNLSSRDLTITAASQTAGTYTATCAQLVMAASGAVGPFRYIGVYDSTASGSPLACFYDYGSAITMGSGDTLTFPAITLWTDAPA